LGKGDHGGLERSFGILCQQTIHGIGEERSVSRYFAWFSDACARRPSPASRLPAPPLVWEKNEARSPATYVATVLATAPCPPDRT